LKIRIKNASNLDFKQFLPLLKSFLPFAMKKMGFDQAPSLVFASDMQNAELPLGKTAHYEPKTAKITIFTDKRHPKDVLRSLSHELVHHKQNCGGKFSDFSVAGDGYTQDDPHLRSMEEEAYLLGNMCFRDWEDGHKEYLQETTYYNQPNSAGDTEMNTKDWKNLEINNLLMERWGYKRNILKEKHDCADHPDQSHEEYMESKKIEESEILQEDGVTIHKFVEGDTVSEVLSSYGFSPGEEQKIVDYHNWRARKDPDLTPIEDIDLVFPGGNLMIPGEQAWKAIEAGDYDQPKSAHTRAPIDVSLEMGGRELGSRVRDVMIDEAVVEPLDDPTLQTAIDAAPEVTENPPPPVVVETPPPPPVPPGRRGDGEVVRMNQSIEDNLKTPSLGSISEDLLRKAIRRALEEKLGK